MLYDIIPLYNSNLEIKFVDFSYSLFLDRFKLFYIQDFFSSNNFALNILNTLTF
jgi:hypothetical protein